MSTSLQITLKGGGVMQMKIKNLVSFIANNGHCFWHLLPNLVWLLRCGKSRHGWRWQQSMKSHVKTKPTMQEDEEEVKTFIPNYPWERLFKSLYTFMCAMSIVLRKKPFERLQAIMWATCASGGQLEGNISTILTEDTETLMWWRWHKITPCVHILWMTHTYISKMLKF